MRPLAALISTGTRVLESAAVALEDGDEARKEFEGKCFAKSSRESDVFGADDTTLLKLSVSVTTCCLSCTAAAGGAAVFAYAHESTVMGQHLSTHTRTHKYMHTYINTYIHTCIHAYLSIYTPYTHTHTNRNTQTDVHSQEPHL
jgi:hypothetical protein